ncbi:DUF6668 family protein [Streptomyces sp. NPDC086091]|uniref:DUF6668 family protein n=1 Tax=Streptomyces sp. NPDC086091 TaxID=3365751 RepID=UPI00382350FD
MPVTPPPPVVGAAPVAPAPPPVVRAAPVASAPVVAAPRVPAPVPMSAQAERQDFVPVVEVPPPAPAVPVVSSTTAQVSWVGAHGGAGVTSLATALGGADVGTRWPDPARGEPGRIMVVARTNAAGIQAASAVLDALRVGSHPDGLQLLGVVLVADAPGRLPLPLAQRARVLRSAATVHRVPWIPSWRLGSRTAHLPRPVHALGELISGLGG